MWSSLPRRSSPAGWAQVAAPSVQAAATRRAWRVRPLGGRAGEQPEPSGGDLTAGRHRRQDEPHERPGVVAGLGRDLQRAIRPVAPWSWSTGPSSSSRWWSGRGGAGRRCGLGEGEHQLGPPGRPFAAGELLLGTGPGVLRRVAYQELVLVAGSARRLHLNVQSSALRSPAGPVIVHSWVPLPDAPGRGSPGRDVRPYYDIL